jgi:hypothetical protein
MGINERIAFDRRFRLLPCKAGIGRTVVALAMISLIAGGALIVILIAPQSIIRPVTTTVTSTTTITTTETGTACTSVSQTVQIQNGSTTEVQTCAWPLASLDGNGCYLFGQGEFPQQFFGGAGPQLCINAAPAGTIVNWYASGLIHAVFPNGTQFQCNISTGGGRGCLVGIP